MAERTPAIDLSAQEILNRVFDATNNRLNAGLRFDSLRALLLNTRILWVPTNATWTAAVTGSGTTAQTPTVIAVATGATGSSTARVYTGVFFHAYLAAGGINFSKRVLLALTINRTLSDTEAVARVQLKAASTEGVLGAGGVGLQISDLTVVGEGYGSARDVTATIATLTTAVPTDIVIVCDQPNSKIDFYVNQVLAASITAAANIPSGNIAALLISSIIRGATGTTSSNLSIGNILLGTEY